MSELTFTFAEFDSKIDLDLLVLDVKRDILPALSEQTQQIPGMNGVIYDGVALAERKIEVTCLLPDKSEEERVEHIQALAGFFTQTMTTDKEFELKISDVPDVTYWCHTSDISSLERLTENSAETQFTITFSCSEGVGYGETIETPITQETIVINPEGTANSNPVFSFIAGKNITQIGISNGEKYIYIGGDFDAENQSEPAEKQPLLISDRCNTLATWTKITPTNLTFLVENGVISSAADITTTARALQVTKKDKYDYFGSNVSGKWHGPARQLMASKEMEDWKITARFYVDNIYPRAKGKIELYLLDISGKRIGKLMVKDNGISLENLVQAQIGYKSESGKYKDVFLSSRLYGKTTKKGSTKKVKVSYKTKVKVKVKQATKKNSKKKGKTVIKTVTKTLDKDLAQSTAENKWTDFYGNITLQKIGKNYKASVQLLNRDGTAKGKVMTSTYRDKDNKFGDKLAGVAVYLAKYDIAEDTLETIKEYRPNKLQLCDVKVWEILGSESEIVAQKDDEITIDCDNGIVYKNGNRFLNKTSIGSEFFDLEVGKDNIFSVSPKPSSTAKWTLDYVPRYH